VDAARGIEVMNPCSGGMVDADMSFLRHIDISRIRCTKTFITSARLMPSNTLIPFNCVQGESEFCSRAKIRSRFIRRI